MKNYIITVLSILFLSLPFFSLQAQTNESVIVHMKITGMESGQAPVFINRKIIFSYSDPEREFIRRVGISFGFEDYRIVYPFFRNENNVFIYVADVPAGIDFVDYRIIVDGLWINDPGNPETALSNGGFRVSRIKIPDYLKHKSSGPLIENGRTVRFFFSGKSGQSVYLSGNFNNWDPFMLKMEENPEDPGFYSISIRIPPGKQYYTFIADGREITDPGNPKRAVDKNGKRVSYLFVP